MKRIPVLLVLIALLASCARTADPATGGTDPSTGSAGGDSPVSSDMVKPAGGDLRIGKPWYLLGGMLEAPTSTRVTLTFEESDVAGKGPINTYSATYTATPEGGLDFGEWITTLMSGPEHDMNAEAELLALLAKVDGYTAVEAGELYLFDGDRGVLTYTSAPVSDGLMTPSDSAQAMVTQVVGMPVAGAQAAVEGAGLTFRVVSRDGTALAVTDDYSLSRINVTVVDGVVTEATLG